MRSYANFSKDKLVNPFIRKLPIDVSWLMLIEMPNWSKQQISLAFHLASINFCLFQSFPRFTFVCVFSFFVAYCVGITSQETISWIYLHTYRDRKESLQSQNDSILYVEINVTKEYKINRHISHTSYNHTHTHVHRVGI